MRTVQGVAGTPQGAYLSYVNEAHGTTTLKCEVYTFLFVDNCAFVGRAHLRRIAFQVAAYLFLL